MIPVPRHNYDRLMRDVAYAYHCRAYNDRERDFWKSASNAADEEDAWLRIEDFIYHVLVPYVAVELISEEMSTSLEDALDVYNRSKTFGRDFNSDLDSERFPDIMKSVFKYYDLPPEDTDDEVRWFINRFTNHQRFVCYSNLLNCQRTRLPTRNHPKTCPLLSDQQSS